MGEGLVTSEWCLDAGGEAGKQTAQLGQERLRSTAISSLTWCSPRDRRAVHAAALWQRPADLHVHFSLAELLPGLVLEHGWYDLSQAGNKLQILRYSIRKRKRGSQDDKNFVLEGSRHK